MRFRLDGTWRRPAANRSVVLGGSPYRIFRLTSAGGRVVDAIESGDDVGPSTLVDRLLDAGAIHPAHEPVDPSAVAESIRTTQSNGGIETSGSSFGSAPTVADVTLVTPQLGGTVRPDGRITVDDGSLPPLADATIRLSDNRGPAAARNAGRALVTTRLIAFVDADVDIGGNSGNDGPGRPAAMSDAQTALSFAHTSNAQRPAGSTSMRVVKSALSFAHRTDSQRPAQPVSAFDASWLDALVRHFADPKVGLVAPRVLGEVGSSLDLGDEPARIRAGTRVAYVPAAAIVVRAEAFDQVGGFDETLRFGEDVDLVWRLDQAGWRCRYEPASVVWHRPRPTFSERLRQQAGYGSSAAPLAVRHPRALAPFRSNGWTAVVGAAGVAGHPVVAAAIAVGSAAALPRKLAHLPASMAFRLAITGHLAAGRQLASAVRRVWWPIAATACVVSKRARWVTLASVLANPRETPRDVAYGYGVWVGMLRHRTWIPIVPAITPWPPRRRT